MIKRKKWILLFLAVLLIFSGCQIQTGQKNKEDHPAYLNQIIPWEMGFLAVGDQELVLEISAEGICREIPAEWKGDIRGIWSNGTDVFTAGEKGQIFRGDSRLDFRQEETGCKENLTSGTSFLGREYCGGENGTVLSSDGEGKWEPCSVQITGTVTGMAASERICLLVTDQGETAVTADGELWSVLRYGEYYQKEVTFQGLTYDGSNFWAFGTTEEGTRLFYTDSGTVWAERDINYLEGNMADLSGVRILSLTTDGQQLYAWCEGGRLLTFPDCLQCNKETKIQGIDFGAAAYNGGKLLIAEDSAHIQVLDTEAAKQDQMSPETAYQKQQEGAVLIDVRNMEEHKEKAIKGSICIPLEELGQRLPEEYPDLGQVLIFYCSKGIRSQSAVETARKLGYVEVYSLGSIDNWKYETE